MEDFFFFAKCLCGQPCKGWELLFVVPEMASMKLIKEGTGESMEVVCVEADRPVVVIDEPVSGLHQEEDGLFMTIVLTWLNKLRVANSFATGSSLHSLRRTLDTSRCLIIIIPILI